MIPPTPDDAVRVSQDAFGVHPGHRVLHARGVLLAGTFTPTAEAAELSRAGHFAGPSVPVTARLSNAGGNPEMPDYEPDIRGLAVKFYLPDGGRTDIVAQTAPRFPVSTPEAFLEMVTAQKRTAASLWRFPWFLARHPGAAASLPRNARGLVPPVSYATATYYAVHAFALLDGAGGCHFARYTFVPQAGEHRLGLRAARRKGREYLQQEIRERLAREPVRFTLRLQIAAEGDPTDDPARAWPSDRRVVDAGTVELTGLDTERETGDDVLVFDPTRMTDGIELSDDPVLRYRADAYAASVKFRSGRTRS
jgi:catalase